MKHKPPMGAEIDALQAGTHPIMLNKSKITIVDEYAWYPPDVKEALDALQEDRMTIKVINRRTATKEEKEGAVYVGRPTTLGNPWTLPKGEDPGATLAKYKHWLNLQWKTKNPKVVHALKALAIMYRDNGELTLMCWCAPNPCHADIIAEAVKAIVDNDLI